MEVDHCVICYTTTVQKNENLPNKTKSNENCTESSEVDLSGHLSVIFLLRKLFKTPQDICVKFLKTYGNPCNWIHWCDCCRDSVEKAQNIFNQMTLMQIQFRKLQTELKIAVQLSENQKIAEEPCFQDNDKWGPTEIVRSCLTKGIQLKVEHCHSEEETKADGGPNWDETCNNEFEDSFQLENDDSKIMFTKRHKKSESGDISNLETDFPIRIKREINFDRCFIFGNEGNESVESKRQHKQKKSSFGCESSSEEVNSDNIFDSDDSYRPGKRRSSKIIIKKRSDLKKKSTHVKVKTCKDKCKTMKNTCENPENDAEMENNDLVEQKHLNSPLIEIVIPDVAQLIETAEISSDGDNGTHESETEEGQSKSSKANKRAPNKNSQIDSIKKKSTNENMNTCECCSRVYMRMMDLKRHFVKEHGELPMPCEMCSEKVLNDEDLQNHKRQYHSQSHTVVCTICVDKSFRGEKSLKSHLRKEHVEEYLKRYPLLKSSKRQKISCRKCERQFSSIRKLARHERVFHPENLQGNSCKICKEKFGTKKEIKCHYEKEHPGEKYRKRGTLRRCPQCPYETTRRLLMINHINTHTNARPHECDLCGEMFKTSQVLHYHQRRQHYQELGLEPIKCGDCGKMFQTVAYLNSHIKNVHRQQFRLQCEICSRGFNHMSALKRHLKRHKGDKSELCEECGQSFITRYNLQLHIRRVHKKEKSFQCHQCPSSFFALPALNRHVQGVHSDGSKPFQCEICAKCFPVRNYLYIHMRSHKKRGETITKDVVQN